MSQPTEAPHYNVDPKTGEQTWSGSSRSEVQHWRSRCEALRQALEAISCVSNQGQVVTLAADALRRTR